MGITQRIEKLPHSYKVGCKNLFHCFFYFACNNIFGLALFQMHSSMCLELKNLVDRVMRIFPDIEDARPGSSTGIQTLCLINKALEKAKLLLQYCSESSKLYMVCSSHIILS